MALGWKEMSCSLSLYNLNRTEPPCGLFIQQGVCQAIQCQALVQQQPHVLMRRFEGVSRGAAADRAYDSCLHSPQTKTQSYRMGKVSIQWSTQRKCLQWIHPAIIGNMFLVPKSRREKSRMDGQYSCPPSRIRGRYTGDPLIITVYLVPDIVCPDP